MSSDNAVTSSVLPDSYLLARRHLQLSRAKLKATSRVSALLAGFAMVAIIELQITVGESKPPEALLFAFTTLSCLLVFVHIMAVMISTCILPHIDSYTVPHDCYLVEEAPHNRLRTFVEIAWICSTVVGIILFLAVVTLACWVKFWPMSSLSAIAATVVLIPAMLVFVIFAILFYRTLITYKVERATEMIRDIDMRMSFLRSGVQKVYDEDNKNQHV
ncbi:Calcium release-activated calcium channel protein [Schistosoma japonicum]|uniref:Calcium release-activated calcium channel protein n=1 Tax=Schistosoma japonicum TaxID=6182 RepID=A0A4Z2DXG9_SCHJA|nr:Calcium release-activated calcium channel protein 1 [Schistosoma japonicum]KAH8877887.1 Calcium release-activated calcium channel protein 1 [Schistosoma japonicum]TNN21241.1 Calcium release-activated calcium channel protein [Schistosoma japonicum]